MTTTHVHDWQPPEATGYPGSGTRYRPDDINMRVCPCGDVGWLVPRGLDNPPPRDGLSDAEAWMWSGEQWVVVVIPADLDANAGGSPSPVEDEIGGHP